MKKVLARLLSGFFVISSLTGFGTMAAYAEEIAVNGESNSQNAQTDDEDVLEMDNQEEQSTEESIELSFAKLPDQYFISYKIVDEDGEISTISKAVDGQGNIYYKSENEYLFLKNENDYTMYQMENGHYIEQKEETYPSVSVKKITEDFDAYVKKADLKTNGIAEYEGEEDIEGRKCDVYSITVKIVNFEQKYTFAVDQETQICMKWVSEKNISGHEEAGDESFICTRFDTGEFELTDELLERKYI